MIARIRHLVADIGEAFWLIPGVMVAVAVVGSVLLVETDRSGTVPKAWLESAWLYNGGSTGARTLLGAVASSTIGVAGTVFSITIAALSLAAGQMGPRLLRSFTNDRGVQLSLGTFLGTFSYALMVLRAVRERSEGAFVPHVALSVAILLAFVCVGMLIYFVAHMAGRINVDTVVDLVSADMRSAFARLSADSPQPAPPSRTYWNGAIGVCDGRRGYLQQLESDALADWARNNDTSVCLAVRPGDYVFPGGPIALIGAPAATLRKCTVAYCTQCRPRQNVNAGPFSSASVGVAGPSAPRSSSRSSAWRKALKPTILPPRPGSAPYCTQCQPPR